MKSASAFVALPAGMAAVTLLLLAGYMPEFTQPASPSVRDAMSDLPAANGGHIAVETQSWKDGGEIPVQNTQFGDNAFPGLIWSSGPQGTKSYAIVVQDIDASQDGEPILHLTLYNIPGDDTRLNAGMVPEGNPRGSSYGPNYMGDARPYLGPEPPPGPKHHYHFQVFALDTMIPAGAAMTYDGLVRTMHGHVLASGEVVGLCDGAHPRATPPPAKSDMAPAAPTHRHQY